MSKQNKANKNNYDQAGRLTPDDMAREREKMRQVEHTAEEKVTDRPSGPDANRPRSAPEE
jgi:hypothetical protein